MTTQPAFTILTVCTGNIHRSPLAAVLLQTWAQWYLPAPASAEVRVRSAGFAAPVGAPMGRRVQLIARALGADGSTHAATRLTDELLVDADLVLTASRRQRDEVLSRVPAALRRTFTIREAGRIAGALDDARRPGSVRDMADVVGLLADRRGVVADPDVDDILDPQGLDDAAYRQMAQEEIAALATLAHVLLGMPRGDVDAYLAAAEDPAALVADGTEPDPR